MKRCLKIVSLKKNNAVEVMDPRQNSDQDVEIENIEEKIENLKIDKKCFEPKYYMVFHSKEHAMIKNNSIELEDFSHFKVTMNLNWEGRGHEIEKVNI